MDPKRKERIFSLDSEAGFEAMALELYRFQFNNNPVYGTYCRHLKKSPERMSGPLDIPFLPLSFFKTHRVVSTQGDPQVVFESSGTTRTASPSKHYVGDIGLYKESFIKGFTRFYGPLEDYCILALLPSYLEREGSSLVFMVDEMISRSGHPHSGFYLKDLKGLQSRLIDLEAKGTKTLLIGVSFALLDLAQAHPMTLEHTVIMETGGMKGRRREMVREELHQILMAAFKVPRVHSEYGMTELLSQAYSKGEGRFACPPWMKVLVRDPEDPLSLQASGRTGGLNIIDLANVGSCSFLATQDLGKVLPDGRFEVLGRFDHSDIRGCNLMAL